MTATPNLGINYLDSSQTSPEITVNEALAILDVLAQGRVLDKDLTAPPSSPTDGAAYIVGPSPTGLWAGHEDDIAFWFDESGVWKFRTPKSGWRVEVVDEDTQYTYLGGSSSWGVAPGGGTVTSVSGTGTVAGLTLAGTVTGAGNITLSGTIAVPVANITASTSDPIGVGSINLGHATDTTITRVSAGVVAIEGVNVVTTSSTDTLSNKTLVAPALGTPASGNLSACTADGTNAVGFRHIPQNSQSTAYTTVLADAGKHIYHPSADTTARTVTIDSNVNVAYPIGTAITFINDNAAGVMTIAITSDTLRLAGAGTTGSRTLAANGIATAVKMTSTSWIISGTGLT